MIRAAMMFPLILAACSGAGSDYGNVAVPEREAEAQAAIDRAVAQNGTATTARSGVPVGTPTENAARDRALPKDFQGYWGITPDDCELANTAATGRINIDADRIRFWESRATVVDVVSRSTYAVTVDLRFSGEGQTWQKRTEWKLEGGSTAMVRTDAGAAPIRYQRC
ncbi:hypothetical protein ASG29_12890 [Sphingomonas sp. Leaf412]|uniref:hypothetical protein n=1 Tax=Sphingomonas sp. Leaf412 TaxID=1736370 RepID=UPI0006F1E0D3|nr:hypothetical protein [Sphingomonas sp. Leaf412]KQT32635.1 hypothetical protein ASG29_12890 [Sphingomonas sp. Leaf412]